MHGIDVPALVVQLEGMPVRVERPSTCPLCKRYSSYQVHHCSLLPAGKELEVVFQCGDQRCNRHFIAYYSAQAGHPLTAVRPVHCDVDKSLSAMSLLAARLFAEAEAAREAGLVHLAGQGYRAAIETLATALAAKTDEELRQAAAALNEAKSAASMPSSAPVPQYLSWGKV